MNTYHGISSLKFCICKNNDKTKGLYSCLNEQDTERQILPDLTFMLVNRVKWFVVWIIYIRRLVG